MEPVTHVLTSLALARAAQKHLPRFGTAMIIVAGVAPDLDSMSYFGGAGAFLRFHRALLHSLSGAVILACIIAAAFCRLDQKRPLKNSTAPPLRFSAALIPCGVGIAAHLILDLLSGTGVNLLWPFRTRWYGWEFARNFDPWILAILIAGILLPLLFRLIGEEIGDRKKGPRGQSGAIVTLVLLALYFGARADFHSRAVDLLLAREYHGRDPLAAQAFPEISTPFDWRGVLATDATIEVVDVPFGPGTEFDPTQSRTFFKPEDSPALVAGEHTQAAMRFLAYARFPLASVERTEDGFRFELRDLRFVPGDTSLDNILLRIDFDSSLQIQRQEFRFASSLTP